MKVILKSAGVRSSGSSPPEPALNPRRARAGASIRARPLHVCATRPSRPTLTHCGRRALQPGLREVGGAVRSAPPRGAAPVNHI